MKIANDTTISYPTGETRSVVLDFTEDLITDVGDYLKLINEWRNKNITGPNAVWLNINQAYVLTTGIKNSDDTPFDPWNLDMSYGVHIFLKGRDEL